MNEENLNTSGKYDEINFGRYLRLFLLQSKLILIITLTGLVVGLANYFTSTKTYQISSLLQVYSPNQTFDPRRSLTMDFFNAPETNLDNLVTLYTSRSNIMNLIQDLHLNIEVQNLDKNEDLSFSSFNLIFDKNIDDKVFYIKAEGDSYSLFDEQKNFLISGLSNELIKNDKYEIQISFSNLGPDKEVKILYKDPSSLYNFYKNKIAVETSQERISSWTQEGLIKIHLLTEDVQEGKKILDAANEIFIKDSIKVETEKAKKSILFIDSQLNSLDEILSLRKSELKDFKQENKSLNVNLEVQSIIELIAEVEQEIGKVDLELSQAEVNFTKDNPLYINLKIQKEALELQKNTIEQKIENLPTAQQEYIDLYRNLEVSEELYSELVNRKLNFSLIEASTIGNIRVVDGAFIDELVSPRISLVILLMMFSFFIGVTIAIFRGIFFISISNPAEIKDAGLDGEIVGVIPKIENTEDFSKDLKFEQAVETSILNIETIISLNQDDKNVPNCLKLVFTSPTPSNGKSFISKNIALSLSQIGHKVLLIDADLKRGDQHKLFNKKQFDLESFKNLSLENIESLKIKENLYLLPKLKKLRNTFEYLYGNLFIDKIKDFESFFDYIIFDTAPVLSVSDTGLLMTSSDRNFLIVRHQLTRINEIKQSQQIINQIGRSFDGIVYNYYQKPSGYYGYYDIYGDYSYRYYAERYLYEDYYNENED